MKKVINLILISLLSVISLAVVHAAGPNIGISPSANNELMSYELKPGTKMEDTFTLQNMGDEKGAFEVYVVDLDEAKKVEKDYIPPKSPSEPQTGVGLWTTLDKRNVTLEPGEKQPINFSITIPEKTPKEKVYKGTIIAKVSPIIDDKKAKSIVASDRTGGTITITSQASTNLTVKVTDNPTSANDVQIEADSSVPNSSTKNIIFVLAALLILSIGYLLYRKK